MLIPFLRARSPQTRIEALRVFATTQPRAPFVDDLATHAKTEKREDALQELVKVLDKYAATFPQAIKPLNKLVTHRIASVRVLATLAAARPGNNAIYKELAKRCARQAHVAVRTSAILGLALMDEKAALPTLQKLRKKDAGQSDIARALDIAIRKLSGADDVAFDFDQAVKQLKNAVARTTN